MKDNTYLNKALDIGDRLLRAAPEDLTCTRGPANGPLGSARFLAELSRHTADDKYWDFAADKVESLVSKLHTALPPDNALYGGNMEAVYTLLQCYRIKDDKQYLARASTLCRTCLEKHIYHPYTPDTLYTGRAGILLTLLHLHALNGERWVLEAINLVTGQLLKNASYLSTGLYWRTMDAPGSGMCGYANGSAGIGWVFLELGHYCRNKAFYELVQKAFSYEDHQKIAQHAEYYHRAAGIAANLDIENISTASLAGAGNLFLQLHAPFPSLFFPSLPGAPLIGNEQDNYPYLNITPEELGSILLKKNFPRTTHLQEYIAHDRPKAHEQQALIQEIFSLEEQRLHIIENMGSDPGLPDREMQQMETFDKWLCQEESFLLASKVLIQEDVVLVRTKLHPGINTDDECTEAIFQDQVHTTTALKPSTTYIRSEEVRKTFTSPADKRYIDNVLELHLDPLQESILLACRTPISLTDLALMIAAPDDHTPLTRHHQVIQLSMELLFWGLLKLC